ncbi:PTO1314 family radical SAM protein [Sulfolobus sp. A20-N-F6]|uniref:PTO1314 family radical SAM protein n=2 Tax=Sulfolobaceae TaxID=118883 RepID=UPI000845CD97|nr:PTO1314 family radical SAM protein [Sulfolobus sp. A20]TRM77291.1 PTO1314 family radical SAM protein [Sulfolobus sp. B5]TRM77965.1 PTO1314 family radical SAM protein [Sulfolobus sp. A20-N-F8]TRM80121.1 PTO1314 family radical SAM protein [Sulfolobus sp. D5]TRM82979.1 PTO1314 family radical SAM protein [Sulfolobus sp. A20-N-F6]TRM83457.1 PTO1314 family radical SAM protein [Sulfolobus sp. F3]TRM87457.1 PTO1314 family radical SAM protein [Sulfolobus sp. C3]TRM89296.1 PTO1314 family radical SA
MSKAKPLLLGNVKRAFKGLGVKKLPLIAGHKLLYSCNLRCRMCPFWRRKDEKLLTVDEEVLIFKSLEKAGVLFIGFEGGEPLLRRDIDQILEEAYKRFHTSLVTNGWLLREKAKSISEHLDYLFVSIDGIAEAHDKIRGIPGSFDKAIEGIREAIKYIPVSISFTITNDNYDQVLGVVELAKKLGITVSVQVSYDYSTAEKLSPEREKLFNTLNLLIELKKKGYPIVESINYFNAIKNSWYYGILWKCKPWLVINIDPQGKVVLPCYVLNEYKGFEKVWEVDLVKLWNNYPWEKYENCNRCALACHLEPSLFSWKNSSEIREKIINNIVSYIYDLIP